MLRKLLRRDGLQPSFRIGKAGRGAAGELRVVLPFHRSWKAVILLLVFDLVFLLPAIFAFDEAVAQWSRFENLFDLVAAVFITAWLLGWSLAPLVMTAILFAMVFGREVLSAGPGWVEVHLGVPMLGVVMRFDPRMMCNLRPETPAPGSGEAWRGPHLAFEYGTDAFEVGSALDEGQVTALRESLEAATGLTFPSSLDGVAAQDAPPLEPASTVTQPQPGPPAVEPVVSAVEPLDWSSTSTLLLIAANLVPLLGTAFWGWQLGDVMVLYWAESAVIGVFNLAKMAVIDRWLALGTGLFFLGHFSGFMAVHFLFLYTLFVEGPESLSAGGDLAGVAQLFLGLWPALLALLLSHGFSFFVNFIGRQEYRGRTTRQQMMEPYGRIIFMHLVLIIGGGATLFLGSPTPVLLAVIVLKIIFDVRAHLREHTRQRTA